MWWCDPDMNNAYGGGKYSTGKIWAIKFGYRNLRSYIHGVIIKVMANERAFKIIDMENEIARFKLGYISEEELIKQCKAILNGK